jgi:hypothetical protein
MTFRAAVLLASLALLLLAPGAVAQAPGAGGPYYHASVTPVSSSCLTCFGASADAGVAPPPNCIDCSSLGVAVEVEHDAGGGSGHVSACRGGFVYICVVDKDFAF